MGFKAIKEHYRIGHSVHVTSEGICIGSPYVSNLIVIGFDGVVKKREDGRLNEDLARYMREFDADPAKLKELAARTDTFTTSLPVYTWEDGKIIEAKCETYGWPNTTHEGRIMYENRFSKSKDEAVKAAKEDAACSVKWRREAVERAEKELAEQKAELARCEAHVAQLNADYPSINPKAPTVQITA